MMLMNEVYYSLVESWREEADSIRVRYADERLAHVLEVAAMDLERAIENTSGQLLTLQQAAERSGYSVEHLGRMVASGKIPNAGRKGAPRIRLADCPVKPQRLTTPAPTLHLHVAQPRQIAGAIVAQGLEANDG